MTTATPDRTRVEVEYERVTVPRFRKMLKSTGIKLTPGTYFEDLDARSAKDKPYKNCFACAVGTVAAFCSMKPADELDHIEFSVENVRGLVQTLPVNYLAGLEQGFEGFEPPTSYEEVPYDGIASETEVVQGRWKPKIDLESTDYKLGKQDGARIRRAHDNGTL